MIVKKLPDNRSAFNQQAARSFLLFKQRFTELAFTLYKSKSVQLSLKAIFSLFLLSNFFMFLVSLCGIALATMTTLLILNKIFHVNNIHLNPAAWA